MKHTAIFLKTYLLITSIVGLFGLLIGYGILAYNLLSYNLISDDIYVNNNHREISHCDEPRRMGDTSVERTPEETEKCKTDARQRLIDGRYSSMIENVLGGAVWGTLFLIIFLLHYPRFLRMNRD